jgi:hypothetical protein
MNEEHVAVVLLILGAILIIGIIVALLLAKPAASPPRLQQSASAPDELRNEEDWHVKPAEDAKTRTWLRPIGFVTRLLVYGLIFWALYTWAPKDISNTPLGTLTPSDIIGTAAFFVLGFFLIRALFNPSDSDGVKSAWGWLGIVILGGVGVLALWLYKQS